jgi:hypothetical protein
MVKNFIPGNLHRILLGVSTKNNSMGGGHVTHIPENEMRTNFWKKDYREANYLEGQEIYGKILIWICKERDW